MRYLIVLLALLVGCASKPNSLGSTASGAAPSISGSLDQLSGNARR